MKKANSVDPEPSEAVWSGFALFAYALLLATGVGNFRTFTVKRTFHTTIAVLNFRWLFFTFFALIFLFMQLFLKILSEKANSVDPDQTAPSEAVGSGSALFAYSILLGTLVYEILGHLP